MIVKLLKRGYKSNEQLYEDFLNGKVTGNENYFSDEYVTIDDKPNFPVYLNYSDEDEKAKKFLVALQTINNHYLSLGREIYLNEAFWHSYLVTYKRDYLLQVYPQIKNGFNQFRNIVIKSFDWENYIYKCVVGAEYINNQIVDPEEKQRYYQLIIDNLDFYNYIIKSEVYRNDLFLIKMLDIVNELNLSQILKAKLKDRPDLGKDERYGRRVIFEMNKSYPVLMVPLLEDEELKELFLKYLNYYYDVSSLMMNA